MTERAPAPSGESVPRWAVPDDEAAARARLASWAIPPAVLEVVSALSGAGYEAVLVGGAVRDMLLGRGSDDFDVATSATPQEIQSTFRRTIPTGIDHGTVTVLVGVGEDRHAVEVTTYRGEGAYHDGRRPSEVRFLRELDDDLARRDFTVNALAWSPSDGRLVDPFGGLTDLRAGVVRAVGVPVDRFREDGLRTMRAVRFCATLGFTLDDATQRAIPAALDVLDRVARERVRVELWKLLVGPWAAKGLTSMAATGLWPRILPALDEPTTHAAIAAVPALPREATLRLGCLLFSLRHDTAAVRAALDGLKPSREERARITAICVDAADELAAAIDAAQLRRAARRLGRRAAMDVAWCLGWDAAQRQVLEEALEGAALEMGELALRGGVLIEQGLVAAGPRVRQIMEQLVDWVVEDPTRNEPEALLTQARALLASTA
jgi:tRNA nucleotidyltransferase (CCA-adding enzyme)